MCCESTAVLTRLSAPKVMVLVEVPEHARVLHRLLPEATVYDLAPAADSTVSKRRTSSRVRIVTTAYAATYKLSTDVLIRGTGSEWPLHMKGFPRLRAKDQPAVGVVIDFGDEFDPRAAHDAQRRQDDYIRRGWAVAIAPLH
jgi:hypothetical protein